MNGSKILAVSALALVAGLPTTGSTRQVDSGRPVDAPSLREGATAPVRPQSADSGQRLALLTALDVSRRELARLIGASPEETAPERLVPMSFAGPPLAVREELLAPALRANPELEGARRGLAAVDAAVSVARSARWPRLDLAGAYVDRGSSDGEFTGEWNVGVQVSYPLFTGGEVGNAIEGASARRRAAEEGVRLAELRVAGALDRAIAAVEEARARVEGLNTAVARSREVARIEQLRLETGTGTQTDYLGAEADLLAARAGLVEARHAELAARAELARVTGRLDRMWVSENLEEAR